MRNIDPVKYYSDEVGLPSTRSRSATRTWRRSSASRGNTSATRREGHNDRPLARPVEAQATERAGKQIGRT